MSGGARFEVVMCLAATLIIAMAPVSIAYGSFTSSGPLTWSEVLGSPGLGENQEVMLIYKPISVIQQESEWQVANGTSQSGAQTNVLGTLPLDLSGLEIQIVEDYPAFTAVLGSLQTADEISERGYHVEIIERANSIGRGAFRYDFRREVSVVPPSLQMEWRGMNVEYPFLLKLLAPPRTAWIGELEQMGVEVLESAGFWTYLVRMEAGSIPEISSLRYVAWVEPYHHGYRMSKELESLLSAANLSEGDRITVTALGMPDMEQCPLQDGILEAEGNIKVAYDRGRRCVITFDTEVIVLRDILHLENLEWVELSSGQFRIGNDLAVGVVQSGQVGDTPVHDAGLDGFDDVSGNAILVAMADSGIDIHHDAFEDSVNPVGNLHRKIQAYYVPGDAQGDDDDNTGHGSHLAGTIAGDDQPYNTYSDYDGHAFGARLIVQDINDDGTTNMYPPTDFYDMFDPAMSAGALIHSNSWGGGSNEYHTDYTLPTDRFMFEENSDFLVVFLAGNSGSSTGTIWQTGNAKNILTVGATLNGNQADNIATFSSRGPAGDGRLKPTIVAPGQSICSARADGITSQGSCHIPDADYHQMSGTSMATPAVAASAALVREYFLEGWYPTGTAIEANGFDPSAALVKAILIASAEEISGSGTHAHEYNGMDFPNVDQGWGRVNLDNALYFRENDDSSRLLVVDERGGLEEGDWSDYSFFVGSNSEPVKVTLVWTDAPGVAGCDSGDPCIRNNLNLEVIDPRGHVYRGNVFEGMNPGQSEMGGSFDDLNVEEVVLRLVPTPGRWRVHVIAETLDVSPQPFALVVTGDLTNEHAARLTSGTPLPGYNSNPSIATDSQGDTHLVWAQSLGGLDTEIWYARYDENYIRAWKQLTTALDDADGDEQFGPVIAISPVDDAIYVVFANRDEASPYILQYYLDGYKSTDGGASWVSLNALPGYVYYSFSLSGPREINDRADPTDLYIDDTGQLHLIWAMLESNGGNEYEAVKYAQSADGITWPSQYLETLYSEGYSFAGDHYNKLRYPKVGRGRTDGGNDYVHAIFSYDTVPESPGGPFLGTSYVRYTRSSDYGDNWPGPIINLGTTTKIGRYNDLAADETGPGVVAVWHDYKSAPFEFDVHYASNLDDGWSASWQYSGTVAGGGGNQRYPAIQMDSSGFVHLAYTTDQIGGQSIDQEIYFLSSIDGGVTWHGGTRVTFLDGSSTYPAITLNNHDTFEVAWSDNREGSYQIYYTTLPLMTRVTYQSEHSFNPSVAVDSAGTAHIVWADYRDGDWDIYYARFSSDGVRGSADQQLTTALDDADGDEQFGPVIAISPVDDTIYVIFANRDAWSGTIEYYLDGYKSTDGGNNWIALNSLPGIIYHSFSTSGPKEISDRADPIDLYVDASGQLHLIWAKLESNDGNERETLNYAQSGDGVTWPLQYAETLYDESYSYPGDHYNKVRYPKVAKGRADGPNNYVHAVYSYDTVPDPPGGPYSGTSYVRHIRSPDNGDNWNPSSYIPIGTTAHIGRYNDLVADETGPGVIAVWHDCFGLFDVYYARSWNDGSDWFDTGRVAGGAGNHRWPSAVLDNDGHLHVSYSDSRTGTDEIHHRAMLYLSAVAPPEWSDARQLTQPWGGDSSKKYSPASAVSATGTLCIAWEDEWGNSANWREIYILMVY